MKRPKKPRTEQAVPSSPEPTAPPPPVDSPAPLLARARVIRGGALDHLSIPLAALDPRDRPVIDRDAAVAEGLL